MLQWEAGWWRLSQRGKEEFNNIRRHSSPDPFGQSTLNWIPKCLNWQDFDKRMEVEQEAEQPSVRCQNWLQSGFLKAVISPRHHHDSRPDPRSLRQCQSLAEPLPSPQPPLNYCLAAQNLRLKLIARLVLSLLTERP